MQRQELMNNARVLHLKYGYFRPYIHQEVKISVQVYANGRTTDCWTKTRSTTRSSTLQDYIDHVERLLNERRKEVEA